MGVGTGDYQPPVCVPLCGASKAYGVFVQWWHHEPQCPAREAMKAAQSGSSRSEP